MKELIYGRALLPEVERHGDVITVVDGDVNRTAAEHIDRVSRLTHALRDQLQVNADARYAVLALNSASYLELWHAAFLGAGVINPLNLRLAAKELAYILTDSGTQVCFTDALFAPLVDQVRSETKLEQVVLIGAADAAGDVPHDVRYEDLISNARASLPPEPDETDPVVLMYTGGTTGLPKGVLLDQRAQMLNLYHVNMKWPIEDSIVYLHQTPMFHAASMGGILGVPAAGARSVFVPAFEPGAVISAIERHSVSMTVMVPTMIGLMMMHPDYDTARVASLRILTYGASPMPLTTLERLLGDLPETSLYQGYGMTEAAAVLTVLDPEDHRRGGERLRSAGRAVPGVRLSIQSPDGEILAQGESGEVSTQAGNFMCEYWNKPEATEEVFRGGWYHTGDAGYLDPDGYLFLVDRVKDMIVTGGENVYSVEVENAIASHPAVAQVAVIGIPHDVWGEAVHAVVVPKEGASLTGEDVIEHARSAIAGYKLPKTVSIRSEPLPLSGAMKVLKRQLRDEYWGDSDRAVN